MNSLEALEARPLIGHFLMATHPERLERIHQHLESLLTGIAREQRLSRVISSRAARVAKAEKAIGVASTLLKIGHLF